ncbi:branched-chain amino acid transport system II carrier protein [Bacilliculturomica massiliensis]|uniref:branched-chain amino acid transport system II carrier protein n=1 Tax=Bacilliculturomica massiliensis TaxID=1917867 RepID=UPI001030937B|nr:branched-chain amino acid transport system II carrier protein [Bacilliculturomica massiliensis]
MKEKLGGGKILSLSLMLFAMFFGAGNMIFPPALGQQAGTNFISGVLGFMVTDAGLSVLGIAAIVLVGTNLNDLGAKVSPKFAAAPGIVVYLLIGPLFALPRTGTVSFEMAAAPFLPEGAPGFLVSLLFTAVFFLVTYLLCLNPSKLVDVVGKILTPVLLVSIAVIFAGCFMDPGGAIGAPVGDYATMPFFKGMVEGYLALDGLAALAFAIVVINTIRDYGVKEPGNIAKYTLITGVFAGIGLGITYLALGYVGAVTSSAALFENGGKLLAAVTNQLFGYAGNIILGVAVLLACLTTSIGLASSFSDYFQTILPRFSYKQILLVVCLFSFAVSNVGLTAMIKITLPALIMIYPPVITLVLLSFADRLIGGKAECYALSMILAFLVGILNGLENAGLSLGYLGELAARIPLYTLGVGWIVPAIVGCLIGLLPFVRFLKSVPVKRV